MTTNQAIQHPNTDKIITLAIGAVLGLAMQHGIDLHEQVATLTQFFSSSEFQTAAMAVLVIFAKVRDGMKEHSAVAEIRQSPDIAATVEAVLLKYFNSSASAILQVGGGKSYGSPADTVTQVVVPPPASIAITAVKPPPVADNPARVA